MNRPTIARTMDSNHLSLRWLSSCPHLTLLATSSLFGGDHFPNKHLELKSLYQALIWGIQIKANRQK